MCLIVFSLQNHPQYAIILAGNRDEFYQRPTKPAHVWTTNPEMIAGKDLKAGGTWLGVSVKGELGAITNHRDIHHPKEGFKSRGVIIPDFLTFNGPLKERISRIRNEAEDYSGYNLVVGTSEQLYYISNINGAGQRIQPGLHGISNAFLDTPWPKVELAKKEFSKAIQTEEIDKEEIFELLNRSEPFPEEQLPDTGLSPEMEKAVSPVFIKTETYGTRSSTLLMIDKNGYVTFTERNYRNGTGDPLPDQSFEFKIN